MAAKRAANADWLDFEQLVTRIERTLAPEAVVKHNDRVWDRDAEGWRQVDVTIRVDSCQYEHVGTELDFGHDIPFDGQRRPVARRAPIEPKTHRIKTNRGLLYVRGVQIYVVVTGTLTKLPLSAPFQYSGEGAPPVQGVEAKTALGPQHTFSLFKLDDGGLKLGITPK